MSMLTPTVKAQRCRLAVVALLAMLAGCQTGPQQEAHEAQVVKPAAIQAAVERAKLDWACDKLTSNLLAAKQREANIYSVDRAEYRVEVSGCGKRSVYTVACSNRPYCSALTESATIEKSH
jgi:hypothetical protein